MSITTLLSLGLQTTGNSSYWLLSAALPPLMYIMLQNKRGGFLQRFLVKRIEKKIMRKRKGGKFGLKDVFGILALVALVLSLVFAFSGGASGLAIPMIIGFLVFLLAWAFADKFSK